MMMTRRGLIAVGTVAALALGGKPAFALGELTRVTPPRPAPEVAFTTADGQRRTLADYKGKPVLVNLWATWCPPCVKELPSLAALARTLRGAGFAVLPISSDMGGAARVEAFYKQHAIDDLPVLIDKGAALMEAFHAGGLPTTFIIDAKGLIVGMEEGGMDWQAPGIAATLEHLVASSAA